MINNEWLESEKQYWLDNFKRLRDDKMNLIDKNEQLKKRIDNLVTENTKLQNELFIEHLKQVETEDFIDKLKKELKEYRGF